jgi:DNA repair exonuclease SbcCD nuclease subunit
MKIILYPDLHLGKRSRALGIDPGTRRYRSEIILEDKLAYVTDNILRRNPDIVVIPGDVFDSPKPPISAIFTFVKTLDSLMSHHTWVISGNHDTPHTDTESNPVEMCTNIVTAFQPYTNKTSAESHRYLHSGNSFSCSPYMTDVLKVQAVGGMCIFPEHITIDNDVDIVVGHFPIPGPEEYSFIKPPTLQAPKKTVFLLGDCHSPYRNADGTMFYSGILERTTFNEAKHDTGFWEIEYCQKTNRVTESQFVKMPSLEFLTISDDEYDECLLDAVHESVVRYTGKDNERAKALKENSLGFVYQREVDCIEAPETLTITQDMHRIGDIWHAFAQEMKLDDRTRQQVADLLKQAQI